MKRVGISVVVMAVGLAAVAVAAPPPTPTAVPVMKRPAQMSVEELSKVKVPPNAKLRMRRLSAPVVAARTPQQPPDLIVLDPIMGPGWQHATEAGFPERAFHGWVVDLGVTNQGGRVSRQTVLKIECEVTGVPPGEDYVFLRSRWCIAFHSLNTVPQVAPGHPVGVGKIWFGEPMWLCTSAGKPRPKFTFTVDPGNLVQETTEGEANNVYVAEFCLQ